MQHVQATSHADFLELFHYEVEDDFTKDGKPAEFAQGFPKTWGQEDACIELPPEEKVQTDNSRAQRRIYGSISAISLDKKLLAISEGDETYIYSVSAKELRQTIPAQPESVRSLHFVPKVWKTDININPGNEEHEAKASPDYILVTVCAHPSDNPTKITFWDLNTAGRLLDIDEPLDSDGLAAKAVDSIRADIINRYEWSENDVDTLEIPSNFARVLREASSKHTTVHRTSLTGKVASFSSIPFSSDGKYLMYLVQNRTTQSGMRPKKELPMVVIRDLEQQREVARLEGHVDAIMWAGFSPDVLHAATVSWDGTMRVYRLDATSSNSSSSDHDISSFSWSSPQSGGQNWAAAFSPDSKHIVLSAASGMDIKVFAIETGELEAQFPLPKARLGNWIRTISWHPRDNRTIVLSSSEVVYLWDVFHESCSGDGLQGVVEWLKKENEKRRTTVTANTEEKKEEAPPALPPCIIQRFSLKFDNRRLRSFVNVEAQWLDNTDGSKLLVECMDGTFEIYDVETNVKWRFARPKATKDLAWGARRFYLEAGNNNNGDEHAQVVSVDGDRKARFWAL